MKIIILIFGLIVINILSMEKEKEIWTDIPLSDNIYLPTGDRICCTCNPNGNFAIIVFDSNDYLQKKTSFNLHKNLLLFRNDATISSVRLYGIGTLLDNSVLAVILAKNKQPDDRLVYMGIKLNNKHGELPFKDIFTCDELIGLENLSIAKATFAMNDSLHIKTTCLCIGTNIIEEVECLNRAGNRTTKVLRRYKSDN